MYASCCHFNDLITKVIPVYKGHSREPEIMDGFPFIYRLKVNALFINEENETVL